jgi:hypothetical protein
MANKVANLRIRRAIMNVEKNIQRMPSCKTAADISFKQILQDGYYIRECPVPKNYLITTAIHKVANPLFLLKGEASILSEDGVIRIKAPFYKITQPGTKRMIYAHKDCVFVTVHRTDRKDIKSVLKDIVTDNYGKKISKGQLKLLMGV